MVQAIITLDKNADRVVNVVKGKYGLKNKSEALQHIIEEYENNFLEPELRPEYIEKLEKIRKQKTTPFKNVAELRKRIEKDV
jgi:endonuclease IV